MNLHGIVKGVIAAVNPLVPAAIQVSVGSFFPGSDAYRTPVYATPGTISASIDSAGVLTVANQTMGFLLPGQALIGAGVTPGTVILKQLTGDKGKLGTYLVSIAGVVSSVSMTTFRNQLGQRQPTTWRDIQMLDGLSLQGTRDKIYLDGRVDGLVRATGQGGDLITFINGDVYKVAQVLEQFPDWVSAAVTQQQAGAVSTFNPGSLFPQLLEGQRPFTPGLM